MCRRLSSPRLFNTVRLYAASTFRAAALISAAPFSAIMIVGASVLVEVTAGITEASMTLRPSRPCTVILGEGLRQCRQGRAAEAGQQYSAVADPIAAIAEKRRRDDIGEPGHRKGNAAQGGEIRARADQLLDIQGDPPESGERNLVLCPRQPLS